MSSLSLDQETSSVLEGTASRNRWLSRRLRCNSDHLISTGCHWTLACLFVVCDAWTLRIRVRCAVDDGCIIHDYTGKNPDKPPWCCRSTTRDKTSTLDTWHATGRVHPCARHIVQQEDSHLCGPLAHMLTLKNKKILTDQSSETSKRVIRGEHARECCAISGKESRFVPDNRKRPLKSALYKSATLEQQQIATLCHSSTEKANFTRQLGSAERNTQGWHLHDTHLSFLNLGADSSVGRVHSKARPSVRYQSTHHKNKHVYSSLHVS